MINDNEVEVDMRRGENLVNMPLMIDPLYNVIVCEECGIELSFE